MHRFCLFCTLLLSIIGYPSSASAADDTPGCLLLNDNTIIQGSIIDFHQGFLYFKEERQILRISPLHFIGIFDSSDNAENALIILNEPSRPENIDEMQPVFEWIYRKAAALFSSGAGEDDIIADFNTLRKECTQIQCLLDIHIYKKFMLFSAIAGHYNFKTEFKSFIDSLDRRQIPADTEKQVILSIEIRLKAIEYLYNNPYISQ